MLRIYFFIAIHSYVACQDLVLILGGLKDSGKDVSEADNDDQLYCPPSALNHSVCQADIKLPELPVNLVNAVGIYTEKFGPIGMSHLGVIQLYVVLKNFSVWRSRC